MNQPIQLYKKTMKIMKWLDYTQPSTRVSIVNMTNGIKLFTNLKPDTYKLEICGMPYAAFKELYTAGYDSKPYIPIYTNKGAYAMNNGVFTKLADDWSVLIPRRKKALLLPTNYETASVTLLPHAVNLKF